ncbi:MAG TPA: hypothetical protein QF514_01690 [Candidatus Thalassarchaeaceae archaeon]|nr:hypothetical protein [Candidatus Thalassarchaeaceae archaeon]
MASVDLVARLVDSAVFRGLCGMPGDQLSTAISKGEFRDRRPDEIPLLERAFDIDAEADFLDWYDAQSVDWTEGSFLTNLSQLNKEDASEGLRHLSELASPGSFRCWEGRAMLYLDVLLNRTITDIEDLYDDSTWLDASISISSSEPSEYAESVVISWMAQREDMGETLDPKQDARLLPTMEAHQTTADILHRTLQTAQLPELFLMVGRDWTDATRWGQGEWNLGHLLEHGLPEA